MSSEKKIRTRIAPSPTGYLHVGTARTALFNWLFARHHGGEFVLRIEDTDLERSEKHFEDDIIEGLKWLGITWDGPITRQSERTDTYRRYITQLLDEGAAYYCFCTKEELEAQRQSMMAQGIAPKYPGTCRGFDAKDVAARLEKGAPHIIRFKMPTEKISFPDLIRGDIEFDGSLIGDIAIAKDAAVPLYNLAVVVDDHEMAISHVIRGEDHIANTPKQIAIQRALRFPMPHYAHLPLILDPNRSKMSKRYSATSIQEYRDAGYLADALVNFLAFLGWHPKEEKEIMSREALIKEFSLDRVQKAGAVFNVEKLNWMNAHYIKELNDETLAAMLGVENKKIIPLVRERIKKLSDFHECADFFFALPDYDPTLLVWKDAPREKIKENLQAIAAIIEGGGGEPHIKQLADQEGNGPVYWPLRVALSGKKASPSPIEIFDALGRQEALRRIKIAIEKLG